jgi:hypothetical protein
MHWKQQQETESTTNEGKFPTVMFRIFYYPVFSPKHKDLNKHNCHFNGGSPVVAWGTVNWSYPARIRTCAGPD